MPTLHAQSLKKSYQLGGGGGELAVLTDVTLLLERGENVAVLGPSGSGKSTLLAILGALEPPTCGTFELAGVKPYELQERALAEFRGRQIGFVFQEHHLLPQCTVVENVLVPLLAEGAASADDVRRAENLIERVGLGQRANHRPAELSGGERQRAALARALIRNPTLLLADEPTGNLDSSTAASVVELMLDVQRERDAILIAVTHSEALAQRMQRRFELDAGRLAMRP